MARKLLTPRWMAFTLFVVAVAAGFCWLGWWQWQQYEELGGSWQNLAYTVQWPIFAAFGVYMWARILTDTVRGPAQDPDPAADEAARLIAAEQAERSRRHATAVVRARDVEVDDELVAYNAYLSNLASRSSRG